MQYRRLTAVVLTTSALWIGQGCAWLQAPALRTPTPHAPIQITLQVDASAYNSLPAQTDETPRLTASGVLLKPGMQVIAVSPDLLDMGLSYGTVVEIEGLAGEWRVVDRMANRWRRT